VSWLFVEPAGPEPFEHAVAAFEVDAVASANGGVTEGGSEERLADSDGPHDDGVVTGLDEAQRAQLRPDGVVVGDFGGVVPAIQGHGRVELGGAGAPVGAGGLASGDLVGEDELEELGVAHAAGLGEGETLGERVEAAAELHPAQQRSQFGGDCRRRHRAPPLARVAKCSGSRAKRPGTTTPGNDGCLAVFSVPRSNMRPISPTLTASCSRALAHATSTRSAPHFLTSPNRA
jgi:hypothetical protein